MTLTIDQLNAASTAQAAQLLDGIYEHSPWIAEAALAQRPFRSLTHLQLAMAQVVPPCIINTPNAPTKA